MTTNDSLGKKAANGLIKFFVGLLMFIILSAITLFVMGVAVFEFLDSNMETPVALTMGVVLSLIYAIIVFVIPYLRNISSVKWFAFCALGDAAWWAYLLFTN
jgi:hypothetical protein